MCVIFPPLHIHATLYRGVNEYITKITPYIYANYQLTLFRFFARFFWEMYNPGRYFLIIDHEAKVHGHIST